MSGEFVGVFSIGQTLDRGLRLYRRCFGTAFFLMLLSSAVEILSPGKIFDPQEAESSPVFGFSFFVSLLIGYWVTVVFTRYVFMLTEGKRLRFSEVLRLATPKDLLYLAAIVLWILSLMLSFILFAIPFLYLVNLFSLGITVMVLEKQYGIRGITRTLELAKKRWWKTFVINAVSLILVFGPIFALAILGASLASSAAGAQQMVGENPNALPGIVGIASGLLFIVVSSLLAPILTTINVVHYNSLRSEKESADLLKQIDEIPAGHSEAVAIEGNSNEI